MLTPLYEAFGVAMAYLAGSVAIIISVLAQASKEEIKIPSKHIIVATAIVIVIYFLMLKLLGQSIVIATLALTMVYVILLALRILRKEELQIIAKTVLKSGS